LFEYEQLPEFNFDFASSCTTILSVTVAELLEGEGSLLKHFRIAFIFLKMSVINVMMRSKPPLPPTILLISSIFTPSSDSVTSSTGEAVVAIEIVSKAPVVSVVWSNSLVVLISVVCAVAVLVDDVAVVPATLVTDR
jgi:hypothetical protein